MTVEEWLGKDNQAGIDIWNLKYKYQNETFNEWLDRVSAGNEKVKRLIIDKKFLFGGRILSNRGLEKYGKKVTLSNCYVISPPEDNIESIFECASKLARTFSYGGGCGIDISKLAPKGAAVNNTAKKTSGAVSFMDLYSLVTGLIGQNGRRGALMISLSCDHPDLEEFIKVKSDLNRVTKANISVRITDKFMEAVRDNEPFDLKFTRPETGEITLKTVNARDIFKELCKMNWDYAEPGILYWDSIEKNNMLADDPEFEYAGTNPCAEEPLPAGGSCLLGSINLSEFVANDGSFNIEDFKNTVHIAVDALNDVLDEGLPLHPLQEQKDSVYNWRQIGLGIMGLGDMFIKMGIKYGSEEAINFCDHLGHWMAEEAIQESCNLAYTNKATFPMMDSWETESDFVTKHCNDFEYENVKASGLYNSQLLTIAPTGSLSTMLGISGGIEPIYANCYTRKTESLKGHDEYYKIWTPIVKKYMDEHNISDEKDLPDYFVTAKDLYYEDRLKMQAVWQKHIDASISSTVNVPNEFTVEDTMRLYFKAWELGLKGVTIFRDGCKRSPILSTKEKKETDILKRGEIIKASEKCFGLKRTIKSGCGTLHCEAFFDPETGDLRECYLSKGSTGGCNNFMIGLSRMISLSARGGIPTAAIVDQLKSCGTCPSYAVRSATMHDTSKGSCCPVAVANALMDMEKEMKDMIINSDKKVIKTDEKKFNPKDLKDIENALKFTQKHIDSCLDKGICPVCGEKLNFTNGCNSCPNCGWGKCD